MKTIDNITQMDKWDSAFVSHLKRHNTGQSLKNMRLIWSARCGIKVSFPGIDRAIAENLTNLVERLNLRECKLYNFIQLVAPNSIHKIMGRNKLNDYEDWFIDQDKCDFWQLIIAVMSSILYHSEVKYLIGYNHNINLEEIFEQAKRYNKTETLT